MKISTETLYLRNIFGDKGSVKLLAEAGFECIDYTMDHMREDDSWLNGPGYRETARELRQYAESLGVRFNQAHAPFEFEWEREGVLEEIAIPRIIRSLEAASIMGIETVIVHPLHHLSYFHHRDLVWEQNMKFFRTLLPYAQKYDVTICLENLFQFDNRGIALPDTCADADRYRKALDELNDPHVGACVDVGHACLIGEDPAVLIRTLGHDRLKALHIHDNDAVLDRHTLPYLGKINWDNVMKALAEIDYSGVFTFESFLFYANFDVDFLPVAARWIHDMGVYLRKKMERYRLELS